MKNFVQRAKPIIDLLKGVDARDGSKRVKWNDEAQKAFDELKTQLTSRPLLQIFNPDYETVFKLRHRGSPQSKSSWYHR